MSGSIRGYVPLELLACMWSEDMAQRFPHADHSECLVEVRNMEFVTCRDWHCNRCGVHVNPLTNHNCPDRVTL